MSAPTDNAFTINVTGSGDPFASRVFRDFLFNLNGDDFPNMRVNLQTNGVLLTQKNWNKLHKIHKNLNTILVSFDASTPAVYAITRRGGDWNILLANVRALATERQKGTFNRLRLDFVVQGDNYTDMPGFVELAKNFKADVAYFSSVVDWGTWSKEVYEQKSIWKETHPEFSKYLEILRNPILGDPIVDLGNITDTRKHAMAMAET